MRRFRYCGDWKKLSTPLHKAIKKGEAIIDDDIIKDNIDIKDKDGMLPIHVACMIGSSIVVEKLLNHGASINSRTRSNFQPFHLAVKKGHEEIIELLLRKGADINANDNDEGLTPLHIAVKAGTLKTVKQLLSRGASVSEKDVWGKTVLHVAVKMGFSDIVEILLNHNASVYAKDQYGLTPLHISDNDKISKMLLDKGANVNAKDDREETPLYKEKSIEAAIVLLKNGIDVNSVNICGETALFGCTNETIVRMILEKGADINVRNSTGSTALHEAVYHSYFNIVEILLDYNADVNIADKYGATPLCFSKNEIISRMLINKGANVNAKSDDGLSPIHWAAKWQFNENVKVLLEYGVDVNCVSTKGATPLYHAAYSGYSDPTEFLFNNGSAVNDKTKDRTSPLHLAIRNGFTDVTSLLLQYGANVDDQAVLETTRLQKNNKCVPTASETIDVVTKHCITLKALEAGTKIVNLSWIDFNAEENCRFYDSCKNQTDLMIHEKIGNTSVSFRDILTKSIHQVATYASNRSIVEAIELGEYKEKFSAYSKCIETKFKMAQKLEFLLKASARSLRSLINYNLPDVVIEEILSYLSYHHLRMLIKASPDITNEQCKS